VRKASSCLTHRFSKMCEPYFLYLEDGLVCAKKSVGRTIVHPFGGFIHKKANREKDFHTGHPPKNYGDFCIKRLKT
jgi:hypothetical protein